jgi:hypothetical protein
LYSSSSPPGGAARALQFFCQHVLEHGLVQRQLGNQPLQPRILFLELFALPDLIRLQPLVLFLPAIQRLLGDPTWRISSATGTPTSACFSTATICSTEKRFLFTANPPSGCSGFCRN